MLPEMWAYVRNPGVSGARSLDGWMGERMRCVLLGGPLDGDEVDLPGAPQFLRQPDKAEQRGAKPHELGLYTYRRRELDVAHPDRMMAAALRDVDPKDVALYDFAGWRKGRAPQVK